MIKIETLEVSGFGPALKALRLPHGLECRSEIYGNFSADSVENIKRFNSSSFCIINDADIQLMQRLIKGGDCEAKVLRGIIAYADITAPVYWWCECETYRHGHERLSSASTMHIDCKGLAGEELQKAKSEIPMGKELEKIDFFSYQCLRNIYIWRKHHRLPEWRTFCEWIESLPYAAELIAYGL